VQLNASASRFYTEWSAPKALTCIRRLEWKLFQFRRAEQNALALAEKHWDRHLRGMLRYWAERALAARDSPLNDPGADEGIDKGDDDDLEDGDAVEDPAPGDETMARAEEWTAFDESGFELGNLPLDLNLFPNQGNGADMAETEGVVTSTPLPGYLRTPSKRDTARAKARERLKALGAAGTPAFLAATRSVDFADVVPPASAPPALFEGGPPTPGAITPFERKLRASGYLARGARGVRTPGSAGFIGRRSGWRGKGRATPGGRGFDDIAEDDG